MTHEEQFREEHFRFPRGVQPEYEGIPQVRTVSEQVNLFRPDTRRLMSLIAKRKEPGLTFAEACELLRLQDKFDRLNGI